jgi:ATP-binding protein involved in chromosome partitioning
VLRVRRVRTYHELKGDSASELGAQVEAQHDRVRDRLAAIRHLVAVMSGKGGVGKSFVTAGLAEALARSGWAAGVLDGDLHGPTAARMLGIRPVRLEVGPAGVQPAIAPSGVRVMSSDLLLAEGKPLRWREPGHGGHVWRGTLEAGMLREFLSDVVWGALDVLLVDLPPGTDRLDALVDLVPDRVGLVVVTIPSDASFRAVQRAVAAARGDGVHVLGVIENMAGYRCRSCGAEGPLFAGDAGERLARETGRRGKGPGARRRCAAREAGRPVKFLCVECDRQMGLVERELPGDGTLAAVFTCPACGRAVAMLTNPMETQLVSSLGIKIGGRTVPEQPLELTRSAIEGGRDDAFADAAPRAEGQPRWDDAARERLSRVPAFVRGMVQRIYTDWAREHGIALITPDVMDQARRELGLEGM